VITDTQGLLSDLFSVRFSSFSLAAGIRDVSRVADHMMKFPRPPSILHKAIKTWRCRRLGNEASLLQ